MHDVILPARNEAETIGPITLAFARSPSIGRVIVVDSCSTDDTARVALGNCADLVVRCGIPGKGEALTAGLEYVKSDRVIFCDTDYVGFTSDHVSRLASFDYGVVLGEVWIGWGQYWDAGTRALPAWLARAICPLRAYEVEQQINISLSVFGQALHRTRLYGVRQTWDLCATTYGVKETARQYPGSFLNLHMEHGDGSIERRRQLDIKKQRF